jgi:hypothetical protein
MSSAEIRDHGPALGIPGAGLVMSVAGWIRFARVGGHTRSLFQAISNELLVAVVNPTAVAVRV